MSSDRLQVAFVADAHVGNHTRMGGATHGSMNARCKYTVSALRRAAKEASSRQAPLFILGDLFDTHRPEAPVIAAVHDALTMQQSCVALVGNHDMVSSTPGDHALASLAEAGVVEVFDEPSTWSYSHSGGPSVDCACIPYRPGNAREWLTPEFVAELVSEFPVAPDRLRVLAVHFGIIGDSTPEFLRNSHDAVPVKQVAEVARQNGVKFVMAGNWHDRCRWEVDGVTVQQVGALTPTGFDNPGVAGYGTVAFLNVSRALQGLGDIIAIQEITGPRFLKVTNAGQRSELEYWLSHEPQNRLYVEYHCQPGEDPDEVKARLDALDGKPGAARLEAVQVIPAAVARSVELADGQVIDPAQPIDIAEEVAHYIDAMPLPASVERSEVRERVAHYLGRGAVT